MVSLVAVTSIQGYLSSRVACCPLRRMCNHQEMHTCIDEASIWRHQSKQPLHISCGSEVSYQFHQRSMDVCLRYLVMQPWWYYSSTLLASPASPHSAECWTPVSVGAGISPRSPHPLPPFHPAPSRVKSQVLRLRDRLLIDNKKKDF